MCCRCHGGTQRQCLKEPDARAGAGGAAWEHDVWGAAAAAWEPPKKQDFPARRLTAFWARCPAPRAHGWGGGSDRAAPGAPKQESEQDFGAEVLFFAAPAEAFFFGSLLGSLYGLEREPETEKGL